MFGPSCRPHDILRLRGLASSQGHQMASSSSARALASSQGHQTSVRLAVYNAGAIEPDTFTSAKKRPWFDEQVTLYKKAYLVNNKASSPSPLGGGQGGQSPPPTPLPPPPSPLGGG